MAVPGVPAAKYGFNTFQEIKSHSSILFNERLAILFYLLDVRSIELNTHYEVDKILEVRALIKQIYKNIRCLLSYNPTVRATLNLETKDPGVYVTDVALGTVDKMIEYCEVDEYSAKRIYIIVQELNNLEMMIKQIMQYFHYFIRPEFRQKPDVEIAVERYKEIADAKTIEDLQEVAGKSNFIDFNNLSTDRIDIKKEIKYDENIDGDDDDEEFLEEDINSKDDEDGVED